MPKVSRGGDLLSYQEASYERDMTLAAQRGGSFDQESGGSSGAGAGAGRTGVNAASPRGADSPPVIRCGHAMCEASVLKCEGLRNVTESSLNHLIIPSFSSPCLYDVAGALAALTLLGVPTPRLLHLPLQPPPHQLRPPLLPPRVMCAWC